MDSGLLSLSLHNISNRVSYGLSDTVCVGTVVWVAVGVIVLASSWWMQLHLAFAICDLSMNNVDTSTRSLTYT